jgi:hypothetical protein
MTEAEVWRGLGKVCVMEEIGPRREAVNWSQEKMAQHRSRSPHGGERRCWGGCWVPVDEGCCPGWGGSTPTTNNGSQLWLLSRITWNDW